MNTIIISFVLQSFLAIEDVGDSLDSVEALIKKHENFEKSLAAQEEKCKVSLNTARSLSALESDVCLLQALEETATRLIQAEHYASDEMDSRRKAVS